MARRRPNHQLIDFTAQGARSLDDVADGFGRVVRAFAEAAGGDLARMATATRLQGGQLTVRCVSSAWAQTIGFMEAELLERLRQRLPNEQIDRIRVISGGIAPPPTPPPPPDPLPPLQVEAQARLEAMVAHIADPKLRAQLLAAAVASERRRLDRVNPAR
ncbi:MAG: hypothetical protein JWO69_418 [Thermoleophilia bacterium]|nr:hypothetical protein [Thermoleophilia bacterium]